MKIVFRAIADLTAYENNSRTHSDAQVAQIAASISEFGFTNPVLIDERGGLIAGHGRVMAAKVAGLKEVPCIVLMGLSDAQRRAYVIADNKLALNAEWDEELLRLELGALDAEGFDLDSIGFDSGEIAELFREKEKKGEQSSAKEIDPDSYRMGATCPRCAFEFDPK